MQVFVTGATGFVGSAVTRLLLAGGHRVRALVRDPARLAGMDVPGLDVYPGDVTDAHAVGAAMTGVDGVFHVAGWYKVGVPGDDAFRVNVEGTRTVLQAMRELGIPRGVYTSTIAVNSDTRGRIVDETYRYDGVHLSAYDRSKAEAHRIAEQFVADGLPLVIVQPGAVYGPGDTSALGTLFERFLRRSLPPLPRRTAFCWGYIDDVALGHLLAFEHGRPGRSYFLCGPVHTLLEAVGMASALTGLPGPRVTVPPALLKAASRLVRPLEAIVTLPSEFTSEGLRVLAGVTYLGRSDRARAELGWRARPLRDGLAQTLRDLLRRAGRAASF